MRITLPNPKRFSKIIESAIGIPLKNSVSGICTDSRQCIEGDLYIAIKGENVDGHDFIEDAKHSGAVAALVDKSISEEDIQLIKVDDAITAIGNVANAWRKQYNIPVIGITGSNGKTTTKELIKHLLDAKYNVHATRGNFNTSIGLPLTLLLLENTHDICVLEMGANKIGDIKTLCEIAEPTDGLITNIGPAHLEGFGSIENIALEKGKLFNHLQEGRAFKNVSDELIIKMDTPSNTIEYGCVSNCDFSTDYFREDDGNVILIINTHEINISSQNIVFAKNVLAAASVANTFGIDWEMIQERINSFSPSYGRSVISVYDKITVIDDTYNANYNSTVAALENLDQLAKNKRKIFVFGDMAELGDYSKEYHQKVGQKCIDLHIDAIFTIGSETVATNITLNENQFKRHFSDKGHLVQELLAFIKKDDFILFKGSRSMEIEKIIQEVFKK
jgi:UDP-N-acetylmuramoyl-tripeptide--D-alanyl-D-alanine ligase